VYYDEELGEIRPQLTSHNINADVYPRLAGHKRESGPEYALVSPLDSNRKESGTQRLTQTEKSERLRGEDSRAVSSSTEDNKWLAESASNSQEL